MSNYDMIRRAIEMKLQVIADFRGHRREMCPHVVGRKNGRLQCLFYQFAGGSSSRAIVEGSPQNWRCIPIEQLANIELREGEWQTANNHSRPQTCVGEIDLPVLSNS